MRQTGPSHSATPTRAGGVTGIASNMSCRVLAADSCVVNLRRLDVFRSLSTSASHTRVFSPCPPWHPHIPFPFAPMTATIDQVSNKFFDYVVVGRPSPHSTPTTTQRGYRRRYSWLDVGRSTLGGPQCLCSRPRGRRCQPQRARHS